MNSTVILSSDTAGALVEAHASMAAWYYELGRALREGGPVRTPDEATRKAFVARLGADFPELARLCEGITAPRLYVPPPAAADGAGGPPPPGRAASSADIPAPPPVDPTRVRYEPPSGSSG